MLRDLITAKILNNLGFYPTKGQKLLASALGSFVSSGIDRELLLINGHAGTGKTSMIASLVRSFDEMKVKYRLMAPTGRASKVLSAYSGRVSSTIHRKIYRQKSSSDGFGDFALDKNLHTRTFFIVDEASMIHNAGQEASVFGSGRLLDDLIQYVYNNQDCKLILIGDTAQLPPVGLELGEALNPEFLKGYGLDVQSCYLNEVVRQAKKSGVLHNATKLREILDGEKLHIPAFDVDGFEDVVRINGQDLLDELESSIGSGNEDESIILTRSNSMANRYNQGIRNRILYREDELSAGDRLMIVKNNYFGLEDYPEMEFIANGDMAEISRIYRYEDVYGFRFADVCICLPDYNDLEMDVKVMLDTLSLNQPALSYSDQKNYIKILSMKAIRD